MLLTRSTYFGISNATIEYVADDGPSVCVHVSVTEDGETRFLNANLGISDNHLRKQLRENKGKRCNIYGNFVCDKPGQLYLVITGLCPLTEEAEPADPQPSNP
jgi:hypothetical protein